jgi:hypothetical protein
VSLSPQRRWPCVPGPVQVDHRAGGRRAASVDRPFCGPSSAARAVAVPVLTSTATTGGAASPGRPVPSGMRPGLAIGPTVGALRASRDRLIQDHIRAWPGCDLVSSGRTGRNADSQGLYISFRRRTVIKPASVAVQVTQT